VVAPVRVALEVGRARTFAVALDWPGWCRAGRTEEAAIESLLAHAPKYRSVIAGVPPRFPATAALQVEVVERLAGNASTEFGAPGVPPTVDSAPVGFSDLVRLQAIMRACWTDFDRAAAAAEGVVLATGPRGGGRDLATIRRHVAEADGSYLSKLGGRAERGADHETVRRAFLESLNARARGEVADVGPRGGKRWSARFAVRYAAWHTLDHAWEIEDRSTR
jgi:hypothetical protein